MDVEYKGQHSIIFYKDIGNGYEKKNSWIDFHMIPATRPYVALGAPNISQVPIPGTSKRVDITDYLPGGLTFGGRSGTWEFYIDHLMWKDWDTAYNKIKSYIHGNTFLINLTDDPYIVYQGVLTISGYVAGQNYSRITIQYDLVNDAITLDEPIDFGDFGRLPDAEFIDADGDGIPDMIDTDGDGEGDVELDEGVKLVTCEGKEIYFPLDEAEWPTPTFILDEGGYAIGIDIDGDGEMDYSCIWDENGKYGLDYDCDGFVDEDKILTPPPEEIEIPTIEDEYDYFDTDCDGILETRIPKDPSIRPRPSFVLDENGYIIGLDITGDGAVDYAAIWDKRGVYGLNMDCDSEGLVDYNMALEPPPDTKPDDVPDAPIIDDEHGNHGYDTDGDGEVDVEIPDDPQPEDYVPDPDSDPYGYDKYDVNCDGTRIVSLTRDPLKRPVWQYTVGENGIETGLDIDGDGIPDYVAKYDQRGIWGIDTKCLGYTTEELKGPAKDADPEDYKPDDDLYIEIRGYDTDCDGVIDIAIDTHTKPPAYIYNEDTGHLIGIDCDNDGRVDIYATADSKGREGVDLNCDGVWDTPPYTPPDVDTEDDDHIPEPGQEEQPGPGQSYIIGSYYPLRFVFSNGSTSNQYGMRTVNTSGNTFGVYDVYTIYQSDVVDQVVSSSNQPNESGIDQFDSGEYVDIIFTD